MSDPALTKRDKVFPVLAPNGLRDRVDRRLERRFADLKLSRSGLVRILLKCFLRGDLDSTIKDFAANERKHGRGLKETILVSIDKRLLARALKAVELRKPSLNLSLAAVTRILLQAFIRGECDMWVSEGASEERRRPSRISKKRRSSAQDLAPVPHPTQPSDTPRRFVLVRQDK